jgi:hypothetical protein
MREQAAERITEPAGLTSMEWWLLVWPELFNEVELDLAQTGLIPDLESALDSRTWHFIRTAIHRLAGIDGTWLRKAVTGHVRLRSTDLPSADGRRADLPQGPG